MKKIIAFLFLLLSLDACAQAYDWIKYAVPDSFDAKFTATGVRNNIIFCSGSFSGNLQGNIFSRGAKDVLLYRRDASYNILAITGGGSGNDEALSMVVDQSNGNVYVTGYFSGTAIFGTDTLYSNGQEDIFVAKYNVSGVLQWIKGFGGIANDRGLSIQINGTSVGVSGYFLGSVIYDQNNNQISSGGGVDGFLFSLSSANGSVLWAKSYGGSQDDQGTALAVLPGGDLFVAGFFTDSAYFSSNVIYSHGMTDIFIARYSSAGTLMWSYGYGGQYNDSAHAIGLASTANNICLTGSFMDTMYLAIDTLVSFGGSDCFVFYLNSTSGALIWSRSSGGPGYDAGFGITGDNTAIFFNGSSDDTVHFGNTVSLPFGSSDAYVGKYTLTGSTGWINRPLCHYRNQQYGIFQSGTYVYSAGFGFDSIKFPPSSFGMHSYGYFPIEWRMSKTNGVCDEVLSSLGLSTVAANFNELKIGENNSIYIVGTLTGEHVYDSQLISNSPYSNSIVYKLDSSGNLIWRREIFCANANSNSVLTFCEAAPGGGIIVAGNYSGTITFNGQISVYNQSNGPGLFVAKYDPAGNIVWAKSAVYGSNLTFNDFTSDQFGNSYLIGTYVNGSIVINNNLINSNGSQSSGFLIRLDSSGNFQWHAIYVAAGFSSVSVTNISVDQSGNMLFTGNYVGQAAVPSLNMPVGSSSFIVKISPAGNILWTKRFEDMLASSFALAKNHIKIAANNDFYLYFSFVDSIAIDNSLTFHSMGGAGDYDAGIVKFDSAGNYIWSVQIKSPVINIDKGTLALSDIDEPIIVANEPRNVLYDNIALNYSGSGYVGHVLKFNSWGSIAWDTLIALYPNYNYVEVMGIDVNSGNIVIHGETYYTGDTICGVFVPAYDAGTGVPFVGSLANDLCPSPNPNFSYNQNGFGLCSFNAQAVGVQYFWDFGDGNYDTTSSPTHQYVNTGIYNVCLTVTNSCSSDSICQQAQILITGNSDFTQSESVRVYPNPNNGLFFIESDSNINLKIYNAIGEMVYSGEVESGRSEFNLTNLAEGLYSIAIFKKDSSVYSTLISKQ